MIDVEIFNKINVMPNSLGENAYVMSFNHGMETSISFL